MEALTAKAALVDPATIDEGTAVTTTIPRSEIEEALGEDGPADLFLDVAKAREGGHGDPQRILLTWEPDDLERLLQTTPAENVTLAFRPDELERMLDEPDVEAQGLREKAAVLSVFAATAAGISAGVAGAQTAPVSGDAGGGGAAKAVLTDTTSSGPGAPVTSASSQFVTDATSSGPGAATDAAGTGGTQFVTDATSSGPGSTIEAASATGGTQFVTDATSSGPGSTIEAASATGGTQFVTDATSSGPGPTIEATATGGGDSIFADTSGTAAFAGGIALLIVGAGFLTTRRRGGPQTT
jgi:hypothetical protein